MQLNVYCEECCEECGEIVHNHIDCPVCKKEDAATRQYFDLREDEGKIVKIECVCGAEFQSLSGNPYSISTEWEIINSK